MSRDRALLLVLAAALGACSGGDPENPFADIIQTFAPSSAASIVFTSNGYGQVPGAPRELFSIETSGAGLTRLTFCNGVGRIVYASFGADLDVYAFTFQIPNAPSPADELNALIVLVRSFNLLPALESTLISKLQDAVAAVNASNTATACSSLTSFISKVQSQSDKKIPAEEKSQLINSATQIKTHLGCQ